MYLVQNICLSMSVIIVQFAYFVHSTRQLHVVTVVAVHFARACFHPNKMSQQHSVLCCVLSSACRGSTVSVRGDVDQAVIFKSTSSFLLTSTDCSLLFSLTCFFFFFWSLWIYLKRKAFTRFVLTFLKGALCGFGEKFSSEEKDIDWFMSKQTPSNYVSDIDLINLQYHWNE